MHAAWAAGSSDPGIMSLHPPARPLRALPATSRLAMVTDGAKLDCSRGEGEKETPGELGWRGGHAVVVTRRGCPSERSMLWLLLLRSPPLQPDG